MWHELRALVILALALGNELLLGDKNGVFAIPMFELLDEVTVVLETLLFGIPG